MSPSKIEWTEETWNPTTGCSKVSPGCAHCYAETLTARYAGRPGWPAEFKPWTPANAAENVILHPERLDAPLRWKTPRMVFVDSMSDLFHEQIPDNFVFDVFCIMEQARQHIFQVLTKRPERMRDLVTRFCRANLQQADGNYWVLPNMWLGCTVENQRWADERIPILLDTPAAVRFISAEPLLGPVSLIHDTEVGILSWLKTYSQDAGDHFDSPGLDWVIIGGESGPKHRPFDAEWARRLVAECDICNVACFVKQLGGARPGNKLEDLPEDLRVRQWPLAQEAPSTS